MVQEQEREKFALLGVIYLLTAWIREKTIFSAAGFLIIGAQAASNKTASPQKTVNKVRA